MVSLPRMMVLLIAAMVVSPMMINGQDLGPPGGENKCGGCPCNSPCTYPSPPPPPTPSPPPPSPPPPPKKPPTPACPPPPGSIVPTPPGSLEPTPPSYIYITGPPGDVYPVDQNISGVAGGRCSGAVGLTILFLIGCSILQLAV